MAHRGQGHDSAWAPIGVFKPPFEVSAADPFWRLVVVGLGADGEVGALATVDPSSGLPRGPRDSHPMSRWESVRCELSRAELEPGLSFLQPSENFGDLGAADFAWMHEARR